MTDHSDDQPDARVYNFPRIGFRLAPATTLTDPPPADDNVPPRPDFPPTVPSPAGPGRRGRRSPLDTLAALPDPGLTAPLLPVPAASPAPAPGHVPDTFHGDDNQDGYAGARLGALSLAACLAVAVAALRGTHTFLTDRRQRRLATETENAKIREARLKMRLAADEARGKHVLAMQGLQSKQAQQRAKQRVQSGPEFGRKSLGRSGSGSGGSGKSSGGRGRGGGAGGSGGSSGGAKKPKTGGGLFGGGSGGSSKKNGNGRGSNGKSGPGGGLKQKKSGSILEPKKSPRRNSQGGSKTAQDKQRRKQTDGGKGKGNGGAGGTGLGAALKKDTQKAAARRWKKRQKRGPNNPALWGNSPKNQKNAPKNSPKKGPSPAGKNTPDAKNRKARKVQAQAAGANRRKLNQALWHDWKKAAARRWKKRTAGPVPPIWTVRGHRKNKTGPQQTAPGGPSGANTAPKTPKPNLKKNKQGGQQHAGRWVRAQAWARKKASKGDFFGGTGPQQADPRQAAHDPGQAPGAAGSGANAGQPGHDGQAGTPGGNRRRRSPFENAGQAAGQAAGGAYTVERDDYVGAQAKQWTPDVIGTGQAALPATGPAALDAAPTTNPPRPGTTRPRKPIPMPQASRDTQAVIAQAHKDAARTANHLTQGRQMDAQHATEITLDDAIDEYGDFKDDAFKTHDQCHKLAARAIKLREVLLAFADDLAVNHNLIGPLFSGAMARMAESMDLVARMAEEMQTSSLQAAEMAETADNDLNDAYRPYNVATADAGLTTPSAPIHNQA